MHKGRARPAHRRSAGGVDNALRLPSRPIVFHCLVRSQRAYLNYGSHCAASLQSAREARVFEARAQRNGRPHALSSLTMGSKRGASTGQRLGSKGGRAAPPPNLLPPPSSLPALNPALNPARSAKRFDWIEGAVGGGGEDVTIKARRPASRTDSRGGSRPVLDARWVSATRKWEET